MRFREPAEEPAIAAEVHEIAMIEPEPDQARMFGGDLLDGDGEISVGIAGIAGLCPALGARSLTLCASRFFG